jgi:hypothetical protein
MMRGQNAKENGGGKTQGARQQWRAPFCTIKNVIGSIFFSAVARNFSSVLFAIELIVPTFPAGLSAP